MSEPLLSTPRLSGLYRERLCSTNIAAVELVLLHGWGSDSSIWRSLLPELRRYFNITLIDLPGFGASRSMAAYADPDALIDQLIPVLPAQAIYLGWSLGGMLAARIAGRYPERVLALVGVAANARFTATASWPEAMADATYQRFAAAVAVNTSRGLKRFNTLQCYGDPQAKPLQQQIDYLDMSDQLSADNLMWALQCLSEMNNSEYLSQLDMPCLHIFAENDALVPASAATAFQKNFASHHVELMSGVGHLLFLSQPAAFIKIVLAFLQKQNLITFADPRQFDKKDVAKSFSRAAASYDSVADLQRRVADTLFTKVADSLPSMMDLGCGTGYSLAALRQRVTGPLIAADLAEGMLGYAKSKHVEHADYWLCGDAEDLPLADESVDGIFSSLSLQWCENFSAVCQEIERVLKPGGSAYIATLGPETLRELRQAWQSVDSYVHVNQFSAREVLEQAVQQSGLSVASWQEQQEIVRYAKLSDLTRELKKLGAHNVNGGRPDGLTGRRRIQALTQAYERFREAEGTLPASYQVWYLCLYKDII
ncbi:malonyl-acyl carrier protein O-methyltransferase BioC [Spongiibacter sp. IMCC21906]|uniref:malonyl-ACP O-methyltransferase BioC n=1 Tax=Spongiibacter sp. IMCC21906 TaxID=1620392 RepID=UPI00062DF092|nr:malonyl-ACP O-methyltransferase BioC [Spongiibacter sp. IMCC21906]AKH70464.1 malonyl-acyl carrier protein O-methyltransferase BioC [Spongiibacter sp. IMCC21906]